MGEQDLTVEAAVDLVLMPDNMASSDDLLDAAILMQELQGMNVRDLTIALMDDTCDEGELPPNVMLALRCAMLAVAINRLAGISRATAHKPV